jgi:hypothetical protein
VVQVTGWSGELSVASLCISAIYVYPSVQTKHLVNFYIELENNGLIHLRFVLQSNNTQVP